MRWQGILFFLFALAALPLILNEYQLHIFIITFYYIVLGISWNLAAGYTGIFSLAHHAFAGLSAYSSALTVIYLGAPIPIGIIVGILVATGISYMISVLTLKMKGIYLALTTWAFAEMSRLVIANEYQYTRGDLGLTVPKIFPPGYSIHYYYIFLALMGASLFIIFKLLNSRLGLFARSIRDDEVAANVMGVNTYHWRKIIVTISGAIAGAAGAFYGHYIGLLAPVILGFNEMATIVIVVMAGGYATFWGPVIGAFIVEPLSEIFRITAEMRMVMFSAAVILMTRFYRGGLIHFYSQITKKTIS